MSCQTGSRFAKGHCRHPRRRDRRNLWVRHTAAIWKGSCSSHYAADMAVYRTTLPIAATAAAVWAILIDFDRWQEWNPSVPSITRVMPNSAAP
jgi:hypothetical protein